MRAIIVSVDYGDLLELTLPYNRHHFEDVLIVTHERDKRTTGVAYANKAQVYFTNAFYEGGANFNKFKALEEGLDVMAREGWLCIMDADVLWPKSLPQTDYEVGKLYTPRRRMFLDVTKPIPQEEDWGHYAVHPQCREFAGYTQIFHASDKHLGVAPWHETNWRHAGGADSFFQAKWSEEAKVRPNWECLHLGPAGENWCGRATPLTDGSVIEGSLDRRHMLRSYVAKRTRGAARFSHEKLP